MAQSKKRHTMTAAHKAALAVGRNESRAVRAYLEALEAHKPKRGRKRTPESIAKRLAVIEAAIDDADPMTRLNLVQERIDLTAELEHLESAADLSDYEAEFIEAAAGYSERRGISYAAWRELGVDAAVLKASGITRSGA
jgi:hypothetical protein